MPPSEGTEPTMFLEKLCEVRASSRRLLLLKHCATQPAARRDVLSSATIFATCADFPERGIYSASMPDGQLVANPFTHFSTWRAHLDTTTTRPEEVFSLSSRRVGALGRGGQFYECPPHPNLLPTRSSRGEGENFWWLYQDAPLDGDVKRTEVRAPFRFRLGRVADMARYQQICAA